MKILAIAIAAIGLAMGAAQAADTYPIDQVLGKADAPVTIIEYASTTCGHCANLHRSVMPKLKAEWIDTGKAKLIYRDFPTAPAALSIGASMIAHCSGPDRYFGVLGMIFDRQDGWSGSSNPLDSLKKLVRLAGMTGEDVDQCLTRQDLADAIQARAADGHKQQKIESTPTLIIGDAKISGVRPWEDYEKALKAAQK